MNPVFASVVGQATNDGDKWSHAKKKVFIENNREKLKALTLCKNRSHSNYYLKPADNTKSGNRQSFKIMGIQNHVMLSAVEARHGFVSNTCEWLSVITGPMDNKSPN